ncbi:hypothetical protein ACS0TY_034425 [Phlomoides rotata]
MDVILPCQKFQLNICEPRYRLMVILFVLMDKNSFVKQGVVYHSSNLRFLTLHLSFDAKF